MVGMINRSLVHGGFGLFLSDDEMFTQYHEQLCQALARLGFSLQLSLSSKLVF